AHDPNDFEIGNRHDLPTVVMMDERGIVTVPGPFEGLDRFEARPAVTAALREQGRIVAEKRPYVHAVGHCSRCDTVVEPRLSLQWFVKVATLAKAAGDAVRDGRTAIHPAEMAKRYFDWVDDMHDWCISRQLWWGHRIPVWYDPDGNMRVVGPDDAAPFALARGANPGVDVPIGEDWVRASRNFVNKVWNGVRFGLRSRATVGSLPPAGDLQPAERWILSRLTETTAEVDSLYEDYQFARACDALFHFAWGDVFDWYLELAKTRLAAAGPEADATRAVLGHVLDVMLRLPHPLMPFVTEQCWRALTGGESLVIAEWPLADESFPD